MKKPEYEVVIRPKSGLLDIDIKNLFHYRDLISLLVRRDFVSQYKQTVLGPLWAVLSPLFTTIIFTVVFGGIVGLPTDGVPPFLFYLCGNVAWTYFANCLNNTANTFVNNANILGKVYFPRLVMPVSTVISQLIGFLIQFIFFLCCLVVYMLLPGFTVQPTLYALMLPLFVLQMAVLGLGFGIIVSALTTKYRDLSLLVTFGVQLWMYASPVAYSAALIPQELRWMYMLNPMAPVLEGFRYAFLGAGAFAWGSYLIGWGITLGVAFAGVLLFSRAEKTFMDTV